MDATDLAAIFELIEKKNIPLVFRLLPKSKAADTFVEMESDFKDLPRIVLKEIATALLCGVVLAIVCFEKIRL